MPLLLEDAAMAGSTSEAEAAEDAALAPHAAAHAALRPALATASLRAVLGVLRDAMRDAYIAQREAPALSTPSADGESALAAAIRAAVPAARLPPPQLAWAGADILACIRTLEAHLADDATAGVL